uniref:BHLH domain-containing protein n=1 Tax=Schistosoma mansoni TaxID=6183 RepID=A0A5K4F9H8_SCHMA
MKNTVQKSAHQLTSSTTSITSLYASSPNPHKRVAANLRERKRMRLINHAFDGLQSHLPKELLRPNTLLSSINSKICTSFMHAHRKFNVELSNKQVDSQLIMQSVNPTNSYFHKETISKVDVLRAAINYIHILEEILDELKAEHCPETWDSAADHMNSWKLDCKQSQPNTYHVGCLCSIRHSNEQRVNKYHKQLMSGTVIKTGANSLPIFVSWQWELQNRTENLTHNQQPLDFTSYEAYSNDVKTSEPSAAIIDQSNDISHSKYKRIQNPQHIIRCKQTWWPKVQNVHTSVDNSRNIIQFTDSYENK